MLRHFGSRCFLQIQGDLIGSSGTGWTKFSHPEDGISVFLRNIGSFNHHTVQKPTRRPLFNRQGRSKKNRVNTWSWELYSGFDVTVYMAHRWRNRRWVSAARTRQFVSRWRLLKTAYRSGVFWENGYGAKSARLWTSIPAVPVSSQVISNFLSPSRSTWLTSDLQQTSKWNKLSPPGYKYSTIFLLLRDTSLCATVRQMLNCLLPMYYSHIEAVIKFLAQECVLPCSLKLLCTHIQLKEP